MELQELYEKILKKIERQVAHTQIKEKSRNNMKKWHEGQVTALESVASDLVHFFGCKAINEDVKPQQDTSADFERSPIAYKEGGE